MIFYGAMRIFDGYVINTKSFRPRGILAKQATEITLNDKKSV